MKKDIKRNITDKAVHNKQLRKELKKMKIIRQCAAQLVLGLTALILFAALFANAADAHPPKKMDKGSYYKLTQLIKKNEGYSIRVYEDTKGNLTVGYGHLLTDRKKYKVGDFVNQERLRRWFRADLQTAMNCSRRFLNNDYNEKEFIVITDMAFNLGCNKLHTFWRLQKHINNHDYVMAAKAIRGSIYYSQVKKRADRNIRLLKDK